MKTRLPSSVVQGIRYACWLVLIGALMGAIFGLFGAAPVVVALFSVSITGVFVILNFLLAFLLWIPNLLLHLFRRSSAGLHRYFGLSFGFLLVYGGYFFLLKVSGIAVF